MSAVVEGCSKLAEILIESSKRDLAKNVCSHSCAAPKMSATKLRSIDPFNKLRRHFEYSIYDVICRKIP